MSIDEFAEYILREGYTIPDYGELEKRSQTILENIREFLLD